MRCPTCGCELEVGTWICPSCGEHVKEFASKSNSFLSDLKKAQNTGKSSKGKSIGQSRPTSVNSRAFDDVGGKLMSLSKGLCSVGITLTCIACAVMFVVGIVDSASRSLIWISPIIAVALSLIIWIGSWFAYALGTTAQNSEKILKAQEELAKALEEKKG